MEERRDERRGAAGLSDAIRERAYDLGFGLVGIAPPDPSDHGTFYRRWLEGGLHGEMAYLARPDAVERRVDLRGTLPGVRSVVVVGHPYFVEDAEGIPDDASKGVIARYARGRDYHRVVKTKLLRLLDAIREEAGREVLGRAYVDTGPLLERELGRRAGLGWFGKNTMLIHPRRGSYFFLGCLLLDLELPVDEPFEEDHCGTCHRCLDACPTGALLGRDEDGAPVMDATRCISYLTIEHRGPIPVELRPAMGNRVYGCDICQEVCPFNVRFAEESPEPGYAARGPGELPTGVQPVPGVEALPGEEVVEAAGAVGRREAETAGDVSAETPRDVSAETRGRPHVHPGTEAPSLIELLEMALDEVAWDEFSRGSAIRRAGRSGFARNVCVGLGNRGSPEAVPVLTSALSDPEPLVRTHAAWALGQVGSPDAREALSSRAPVESDESVRSELAAALAP